MNDFYDIERFEHHIRVTEKRKYGWSRCFSINEAFELATKLPDIIEEMLAEGMADGDREVDRGQAGG
jgi:hypothetical protein